MKRGLGQTNLIGITTGLFLLAATAGFGKPHVGGLAELYSWREDSVNLVKNSSFEQVDEAGRVSGWKVGQPGHFFPVTDVARSGLRSMYLRDSHLARRHPSAVQALSLTPGWYSMKGWIKAEGAGSNKKGAGGRISVKRGKGRVSSRVIRGTTNWTKVVRQSFLIMQGESAMLRLEAYRKPNGSVFFDDIEVHRLISPVVEGFLLYPNYRGFLFDDRSQTIRMSVTVRPQEAKARLSDLTIRLSLNKVVDGVYFSVTSIEENPTKFSFVMTLDAGKLPAGAYTLRLQALRRGTGRLVFEYPSYRIVKAPSAWRSALRTYVDSDNVLVLDGKRKFVLGIYDTGGIPVESEVAKIAEAPLDLYLNYWLGARGLTRLQQLASRLQTYGMWYLHTVTKWYEHTYNWQERISKITCDGQTGEELGAEAFTACMAREISDIAGIAGYYVADEKPVSHIPRIFGQYKTLRANSPRGGVTFIAQNRKKEVVRWRDAADVIDVHRYPIYNVPEGSLSPLQRVTETTEAAREAVEGSR
ncbi:MAG: hypothetical protein O7B35_16275, partial [Deltaproteobacteria bacterium]|nr:hypothetical protein [Deltaproteobacteria bacterium]